MPDIIVPREALIPMVESLKQLDSRGEAMRSQFVEFDRVLGELEEKLVDMRGAVRSATQSNQTHSESLARLRTLLESLL